RNDAGMMRNSFADAGPNRDERRSPGVMQAYANTNAPQYAPSNMARQPMPMQRVSQSSGNYTPMARSNMPRPLQRTMNGMPPGMPPVQQASMQGVMPAACACGPGGGPGAMGGGPGMMGGGGGAVPAGFVAHGSGRGPSYDNANMPGYAWPSYA